MIRLARESDAPAIRDIYAPIVERTAISFETEPPSPDEMRRRISSTLPTYPWLVRDDGAGLLGYAYAGQHRTRAAYRWSVDVTIYVAEHARRSGVGRSLYEPLLAILARQGFHAAFAGITLPNPGSVGVHEAVGFTFVGSFREVGFKLGAWHDVGWWQRSLRPPPSDPAEPLPFSAVMDDPEVRACLQA